jgi:hypothetical protein
MCVENLLVMLPVDRLELNGENVLRNVLELLVGRDEYCELGRDGLNEVRADVGAVFDHPAGLEAMKDSVLRPTVEEQHCATVYTKACRAAGMIDVRANVLGSVDLDDPLGIAAHQISLAPVSSSTHEMGLTPSHVDLL